MKDPIHVLRELNGSIEKQAGIPSEPERVISGRNNKKIANTSL